MDIQSKISSQTWRKNLYSNVGYKDNYTDISFLTSLKTNINQKPVRVLEAVTGAAKVTEQLCLVFNFVVIYYLLVDNLYRADLVLIQSSFVTFLCYLYYLRALKGNYLEKVFAHVKTVVIFFTLGYVLSPVLKTLTQTISTDTINATTFIAMFIHLVFFDYNAPAAVASRALSLNAAIFGSLCLASRVPTSFHAFVLLTTAVQCFVLYPAFVFSIRKYISILYRSTLVVITILLLLLISTQITVFFVLITLFVNVFCPLLYVFLQKYKYNIYGPWDEAVIAIKK